MVKIHSRKILVSQTLFFCEAICTGSYGSVSENYRYSSDQLQNTGPFFEVYYLSWLVGSPVALSVYRTTKVYYLVAQQLVGSPVALSVYRTSKYII